MPDTDVLVIGAGPAGSTLAYLLAKDGLAVTIVDKAKGAEFKIGESLLPEGVRLCRELGLGEALRDGPFLEKHAAQFILSEDGVSDRFEFAHSLRPERGTSAYQVKREDFDALLHRHAEGAGAWFRWGFTVRGVELEGESVVALAADGERVTARFLVDASGLAHVTARRLGSWEPLPELRKTALFSHFAGIPREVGEREGDIRIVWTPTGWFWVIPFADGTTSVGVVGDPDVIRAAGSDDEERFDALCRQSAVHRSILDGREPLRPLERRSDYSFANTRKSGERFLAVGDAGGFLDPIFSTGVFFAQAGAFLAFEAIAPALRAGSLPDEAARRGYEEKVELAVRRYRALVGKFYDRAFMDDVVRSRRREQTRAALTSLLAGDVFHEDNPILRMGLLDGGA